MTGAVDRFLRSPEFLELMASSLKTLAGARALSSSDPFTYRK
jgi:hypothetical protein